MVAERTNQYLHTFVHSREEIPDPFYSLVYVANDSEPVAPAA
jgi:hypothetical protein